MDMIREMSDEELRYPLESSSYVRKVLKKKVQPTNRAELEQLYKEARKYACRSIVDNLKSFEGMHAGEFYHLDCSKEHFFILARVRTNCEWATIEETAEERDFLSFSILTEKNLSHFPGRVLYGYQGIDPSMIGYICHRDADTYAFAKTRLELSEFPEELLDIDDLCTRALLEGTYCQVSAKSKKTLYVGPIIQTKVLLPSVVLAIDAPTRDDALAAAQRELPTLVLHPSTKTIMNVSDFFFTPELANPMYI